jgi:hypothetical protein
MDESEKKLLSEIYRINQENNAYLRKIDRRQRYNTYWKVFLFILAVGSALGLYYVVQPYIDQVSDVYNQAQSTLSSFIPQQQKTPTKK